MNERLVRTEMHHGATGHRTGDRWMLVKRGRKERENHTCPRQARRHYVISPDTCSERCNTHNHERPKTLQTCSKRSGKNFEVNFILAAVLCDAIQFRLGVLIK